MNKNKNKFNFFLKKIIKNKKIMKNKKRKQNNKIISQQEISTVRRKRSLPSPLKRHTLSRRIDRKIISSRIQRLASGRTRGHGNIAEKGEITVRRVRR